MNQLKATTNKVAVRPSPLFGSIWIALYCFLRDNQRRTQPETDEVTDVKEIILTNRH